ncbi:MULTISPECIES: ABC transporter ATP-binding protein [unclassified Ruegeria]|uniref:ABC transporter ATP-binding protein n=1 Tax=unclassified Ruegeria TaxID=2625375 RepID=UPI00148874B1|nr:MULTISPECIES: ABC transporter ATP-binding protein [unclassified Ruegeria]NOD63903.1 ABC transporter ATP-binding protein [Ruegeria sp. HKCCD6109]
MSIAHLLEDFTAQTSTGNVLLLDEETLEEQRLASFEEGYGAGWEDASQAQEQSRGKVSAELAQSLEDMSFTCHEAMMRMTMSLEPMFESLVQKVLPQMVEQGLAARLVEQLSEMARSQIEQPMQIMVPIGCAEDVKALLLSGTHREPNVIEDPSLEAGQARLQVGTNRREVDCSALLTTVAQIFDAYVFEAREALSNE